MSWVCLGMRKTSWPRCAWCMEKMDGRDRCLTLKNVWAVGMPTALYINLLSRLFDSGRDTPMHILMAMNDDLEYHKQFMTLKEKGDLEGQGLNYHLDIMQSLVILTALRSGTRKARKLAYAGASSNTERVSTVQTWPC